MRRPVWRAAAAAAMLVACVGELEQPSVVRDLRILAIQAEPPEVVLDGDLPPVALATLVADPRDPERTIGWQWQACGLTDDLRCASADTVFDLGAGTGPLATVGTTLTVTDDLVAAARELDTYRGFEGVSIVSELVLAPGTDEELHAIKQVPSWYGLPPGVVENSNPSPPALRHDDAEWLEGEILEVAPGAEVSIEPVAPPEDSEHFGIWRFDLGVEELDEHLRFAFFATSGTWSRNETGGPPSPIVTETSIASHWTAPAEQTALDVAIWVVVRDGRGGTAWTVRRAHVAP